MESEKESDKELEEIRKKKMEKIIKRSEIKKPDLISGGKPITLNETNFWEMIQKKPKVLIDCFADWCGPCKMLEPIFEQLATVHRDILIGRINVDYAPKISRQFQIKGIPLILFFKKGQFVNKLLGAQSYETIEAYIQRFLS